MKLLIMLLVLGVCFLTFKVYIQPSLEATVTRIEQHNEDVQAYQEKSLLPEE